MNTIPDIKNILLVAEKNDSLSAIEELLYGSEINCIVDAVSSSAQAFEFLRHDTYDAVVLDITRSKGYELLKIINKHQIPSLRITSHTLTQDLLRQPVKNNMTTYVPKDKLVNLPAYVADVLTTSRPNKNNCVSWFSLHKSALAFGKLFITTQLRYRNHKKRMQKI